MVDLASLIERVEKCARLDNALDVEIEVALFEPDDVTKSCRPNNAGTKVIYTHVNGRETTYRADDWTMNKPYALKRLRAALHQDKSHD
ncbi:hypothetical protein NGM99_13985 [Mesorhizobium sp. RP14(2022)]|uniref:Uncharacterized protein n=1 Tax=Mesorhizobium liriopis TaxID=2953882 RepID=A0ABT1C7U2_9HYPH|nr:hypothetical protein [Mesorhizobium liriopis]MCO6050890.1 hypothetical protein [Mesorhizobium liriopis]